MVKPDGTTGNSVYIVKFSKADEVPMIITVNLVCKWMNEFVSVLTIRYRCAWHLCVMKFKHRKFVIV